MPLRRLLRNYYDRTKLCTCWTYSAQADSRMVEAEFLAEVGGETCLAVVCSREEERKKWLAERAVATNGVTRSRPLLRQRT